jgi:hypothetical protein
MESKFGPLDKRVKMTNINEDEIFQKNWGGGGAPFLTAKGMKKFWKS